MRNFSPKQFKLKKDFVADIVEMRLQHSGEYVYHILPKKDKQAVVMNYQFIPADASATPDFLVNGTDPKLFGYIEHFENQPEKYREGNAAYEPSGSKFEVRGIMYIVKKIDIDSTGLMVIDLVQDDKCVEKRCEFDKEMADHLC